MPSYAHTMATDPVTLLHPVHSANDVSDPVTSVDALVGEVPWRPVIDAHEMSSHVGDHSVDKALVRWAFESLSGACAVGSEIAVREWEPVSAQGVCRSIIPPQLSRSSSTTLLSVVSRSFRRIF